MTTTEGTRRPGGCAGRPAGHRGFTVAVDREAGQVTWHGPVTGAGGGAYLIARPGVELVFDRAGGWLSALTVTASAIGGVPDDEAVDWIAGVFGTAAAAVLREAPRLAVPGLMLRAHPGRLGALSRLARLDAARITSAVPAVPLWDAEAADLARRAGLPMADRASPAGVANRPRLLLPASVMQLAAQDGPRYPEGALDLGLVPPGIFRPGLWPAADLAVRADQDGAPLIAVEAELLPGVTPGDLADCRARLVDASRRRVLAAAPMRICPPSPAVPGSRARAQLPVPCGWRPLVRSGAAWAEVVDDEQRPVNGIRLRRIRRALRWADAALRAESRPHGLAPELTDAQWSCLAALAWKHCGADWEAAGRPARAALAATRGASRGARPFLAELVGVQP